MQEFVFYDGKFIEKEKASLPIMTHAFLYYVLIGFTQLKACALNDRCTVQKHTARFLL